ncbi:RNA polymerase sigma factor [Lentzea sp. NBRC 105346]|uniref:RNA polymerase sigma factor n=1 Tax=Lentzea sp. NBRC 105346 TaxID=3032205 RepID=UPI0024A5BCDD|nr:sigma-70 family RNA polymerase sigma factor [Lentzea sp. NBRC 105346]GLZ34592.1 RNA polymerase sigma factor [Lentzea sp. NBRC 105346]
MTSASPIAALVSAAAEGDQQAWNEIVDRYTPLVVSVIYKHRLRPADAADVNQTLWLRLVEQIGRLREPEALPGWIMTTTRNECLRVLRVQQRTHLYDPLSAEEPVDAADPVDLEEELVALERRQALRDGFRELTQQCQRLLTKLMSDPPPSYQTVSEELAMPIGSIGPTRIRCLDKLRKTAAIGRFIGGSPAGGRGGVLGAASMGK